MARQRDLTFYLVKDDVMSFDAVLPPAEDTLRIELGEATNSPFDGLLVIRQSRTSHPWWATWLRESVSDVPDLLNSSNSAAIILHASERIFVVTFDYGRSLMSLDCFERDFGLRVALNIIEPTSLRSIDARTFEQLTLTTRSQTSRTTSLDSFRIRQAEDILKGVTGTPQDTIFGSRITGADAAKLTHVPDLTGLHEKCVKLLLAYESHSYKHEFGFIDDLRTVRDPTRIEHLNECLIGRLSDNDLGTIHMAPPEVTDVQDIDQFVFSDFEDETLVDLDIDTYCTRVLEHGHEITLHRLRKGKVGVTYRGGSDVNYLWSTFDCVVAEIREGNRLFVLSGGTWYQIEGVFAERVAQAAERRSRPRDGLPSADPDESEAAYNERAANDDGITLLDGFLIRGEGARSPIEFCDLLDKNRRIVHVKRRARSSTLSHLFSQGAVSAEAFLRDVTFRRALLDRLSRNGHDEVIGLISEEQPDARNWEIVYAIIGTDGGGPRELPFFSQLNFMIAAERLENSQFRVSLQQIPVNDSV